MIKIELIFFKIFFCVSLQHKTYFLSKSAYPAGRGFTLTWLLAFTMSLAWLVCRVVGLSTSREKPLQQAACGFR